MGHIIGIDPGASGGAAVIHGTTGSVETIRLTETAADIVAFLDAIRASGDCFAHLERVNAFPGQGVSSSFKFGMSYGRCQGWLDALGIPYDLVTPQTWQKGLRIAKRGKVESKTDFKRRLRGDAQRLFPDIGVGLATADAILIAEYGRRKRGGCL